MVNWQEHGNPFLNFTEQITQQWTNQRFTKWETQEWLNVGLKANDAGFAAWLRDIKGFTPIWFLNYGQEEELGAQFNELINREDRAQNWLNNELEENISAEPISRGKKTFSSLYLDYLIGPEEKEETEKEKEVDFVLEINVLPVENKSKKKNWKNIMFSKRKKQNNQPAVESIVGDKTNDEGEIKWMEDFFFYLIQWQVWDIHY